MNQRRLKELLSYDKNTGIFRWKVRKAYKIKIGDIAGNLRKDGYKRVMIDEKLYSAHRLAWLYVYGEFPKHEIDHINHNKGDNRISNLRDVTRGENRKNLANQRHNTSGTTGVAWYKPYKKWVARIRVNGKQKHLGYFDNINEAKIARQKAKIKYGFHINHD